MDLQSKGIIVQNALFPTDIQDYLQVLNIFNLYLTFGPRQN